MQDIIVRKNIKKKKKSKRNTYYELHEAEKKQEKAVIKGWSN
jgi:hypothetical protein